MLTVYEFLSRIVTDPQARLAFEINPRGSLEHAGLSEMTTTEFVHAASLSLDFVPLDVVEAHTDALHSGMAKLVGGSQHVALTLPAPFLMDGHNNDMEWDLATPEIFSSLGDTDELLPSTEGGDTESTTTEESDSHDSTMSPIGSGNEFRFDGLVGDIDAAGVTGGLTGISNSGDLNTGNVAGNGVTDVVGGVQDTVGGVGGGDVMGQLGDLNGIGDVTGGLNDLGGVMPEVGGVTNALPVENSSEFAPESGLTAPVTGSEGPVGAVDSAVGDLTGDLGGF